MVSLKGLLVIALLSLVATVESLSASETPQAMPPEDGLQGTG